MAEELDEFGIPKKTTSAPTVDEYGIAIKKKEPTASISLNGQSQLPLNSELEKGQGLADNSFLKQIGKDAAISHAYPSGMVDIERPIDISLKEKTPRKDYYSTKLEKGLIFDDKGKLYAPSSEALTAKIPRLKEEDINIKKTPQKDLVEQAREMPIEQPKVEEPVPEGEWGIDKILHDKGLDANLVQNVAANFELAGTKLAKGATEIVRDLSSGLSYMTGQGKYPELFDKEGKPTKYAESATLLNDPAGVIALGLQANEKRMKGVINNNQLPSTFWGNAVSSAASFAPDIVATALLPEARLAEGASLIKKTGALLINNFTKYMTVKGGVEGYGEARTQGKGIGDATIEGLKGTARGFENGVEMAALGAGSNLATKSIMAKAEQMGLRGTTAHVTRELVNLGTDVTAFALLGPQGHATFEGRWITAKEIADGTGIAALFRIKGAAENIKSNAELNEAIKQTQELKQGVAIGNFVDADHAAIERVYYTKESADELHLMALDFAKKARETSDLEKKAEYIAKSMTYEKAANVKQVTEDILNNPESLNKFEESGLPESAKQEFLQKAEEIRTMLDPIEQQKTALGEEVKNTKEFIKQATEKMNAEPDDVKKAELEVRIEEANKYLEENNNKLKNLIKEQIKPSEEEDLTTDKGIKKAQKQFNKKIDEQIKSLDKNNPDYENDLEALNKKKEAHNEHYETLLKTKAPVTDVITHPAKGTKTILVDGKEVTQEEFDAMKGKPKGTKTIIKKPNSKQIQDDIKNKRFASFTYKSEAEVPDVFKDKIVTRGENTLKNGKKEKFVRVTVPQSIADYELSKGTEMPVKEIKPAEVKKEVKKTTADTVAEDLLSHLGIENDQNKPKFQLEKSGKIEPKMPKKLGKGATKEQKLKYAKDLEKYAKDKALYDQDVEAVNQANKEVAGIFDRAEIEQQQSSDEPINIDVAGAADVPTQKIEVSETDKRPEAGVMSKLSIKMGDWVKGAKVALGMSDTLRTGEREVTELDKNGNKVTKTIRDEGGIGFPFKSFIDLINGKIESGKKAMGWAAVGEGAGTSMLNAAKKSKKITGAELKEHYYKNLNLTPEQKKRLNEAIPDDKEYGLVTIYKMGDEGIRSNEAFAKEAFRLMDVKLTDAEKANAFKIAEDRLDKITWGENGVKEKYIQKLKDAKSFEELESIINGEGSDMSLGTKAEIMQKIFLGTEKTTSTENVNPLSALLKEKGISIEGISRTLEEPIMSGIDAGQPMILLAIDPTSKVVKDTQRHANYSYGVEGFPIGLFNETSQMHHLSPEMMDTYVKTATTSVDENVTVRGSKEKARISISHDRGGNYTAELGKGATKVQFTDKKGVFTKSDGKFYDSNGKPIKESANPLSFKSKEEINNELKKLGYTVSEASAEPYTQNISGSNISNLMQKAKAGIISFFENPNVTAQQKLVKYINKAFPNIDISLNPEAYKKIEEDFRNKKLLNVGQKTFGVVDSQTGKIYLNPEVLNNNTPIHELGHVWNIYAKQYKPEIYNKGLELITDPKNSTYLDSVLNNTKYQKLIKDAFGNDALIKNRETGDYEINKNHSKFNDINEYVADEALAKAIGDKGELFVNESQKRNFEKFLETLYSAVKQVLGFDKYSSEEFQNLKLNDFVNAAVKDILGGKEISKISSNELAELTKDITLPKFQLEGNKDDKIREFIDIQRGKGILDKDIKIGLEKVADKIGIDSEKINDLLSKKVENPVEEEKAPVEFSVEEAYKQLPKAKNLRENAQKTLINSNFDKIVEQLIKNDKIQKKC